MALEKTFKNENGYDVSYWKCTDYVCGFHHNTNEYIAKAYLDGYKDTLARDENKLPAMRKIVVLSKSIAQTSDDFRDDIYTAVKQTKEFSGSLDV